MLMLISARLQVHIQVTKWVTLLLARKQSGDSTIDVKVLFFKISENEIVQLSIKPRSRSGLQVIICKLL